jgi:hypothetical protein
MIDGQTGERRILLESLGRIHANLAGLDVRPLIEMDAALALVDVSQLRSAVIITGQQLLDVARALRENR